MRDELTEVAIRNGQGQAERRQQESEMMFLRKMLCDRDENQKHMEMHPRHLISYYNRANV